MRSSGLDMYDLTLIAYYRVSMQISRVMRSSVRRYAISLSDQSSSMRSLLSIADLSLREILSLMRLADHLRSLEESELGCILAHKILATLFYEPSTRTRLSFESAMLRL